MRARRLRWLAAGLAVPAFAGAAWAFWSAEIAPGGHGAAAATEVGAGARPTATADGGTVTVTWDPAEMSDGTPVTDYVVVRADAATGTVAPTEVACAGRVAATTCVELVSDGTWSYTVTPAVGTHWRGPVSPPSAPVVVDTTGPTGGSVAVLDLAGTGGRYSTTQQLRLALAPGTDPNGLAPATRLLRAAAPLTSSGGRNGVCGTFGTAVPIVTDPATELTDTVPDATRCYRYQYVVTDTFGNATTYTGPEVAVDTSAPSTPALYLVGSDSSSVSGTTVYYRPGVTGSFKVTVASTDTGSGVAAYSFPDLGAGWTRAASGATATYTWTGIPAVPDAKPVTARNHAGGTSAPALFTATPDGIPPTEGTVSYRDGLTTASRITVELTHGSDSESGIVTRVLQRAAAPLVDGACGTYGPFGTVVNGVNPPEPRLDPVEHGFCYQYQYVVTDKVGNVRVNTSPSVAKVLDSGYAASVKQTAGLSSYWRLGEPTMAYDSFTGPVGTTVHSRSPELGAPWAKHALATPDAIFTAQGRIRRNAEMPAYWAAVYYSTLPQDTTDYTVEADLHHASALTNDMVGVTARQDGVTASGYGASYDQATQSWQIGRMVNGVKTVLSSSPQVLTPGATYHLAMEMRGSSIRLLVDGTEVATAVDTSIQIGTGGFVLGLADGPSPVPTDTTGMHLDNFRITPAMSDVGPSAAHGHYLGASILGAPGAPLGDENTAARFDGVRDEGRATARLAGELSVELWFSSTQGAGSGVTWRDAAGLLATDDLGIGLAADGSVVAGTGTTALRSPIGLADGRWHHVVLTRAAGTLKLYVDGAEVAPGEANGEATGEAVPAVETTTALALGRGPGGFFTGLLDEVALYTGALTPETVAAHHFTATH